MAAAAAAAADHDAAPRAHALILPYPAQGPCHPAHGARRTASSTVASPSPSSTPSHHRRVVAAAAGAGGVQAPGSRARRLRLVAVADGMGDGDDRDNLVRLNAVMEEAIPPQLEPILDGAGGEGQLGQGDVPWWSMSACRGRSIAREPEGPPGAPRSGQRRRRCSPCYSERRS
ncbi:hypothetical protein OsJ_31053 [Oryza sativa Japonica Group]|uniref:Uncharacterized protein n=1 Tax=Oryza sativa subsp. japonica TaxID=39947 RepID=A3C3H8_ORYSJ|nr:hypothetical protein OsJ_31053 [Oryza sativa Japonica Group]